MVHADCLVVEELPIDSLVPNERNPRVNDRAVDAVARSITAFGFNNPIVTDGDLRIAAGHTRLKAARKLGMATVPVIRVPGLVGSKFAGFSIADNRVAEIADWDEDMLGELLTELNRQADFDLGNLGFSENELSRIMAQDDDWFDEVDAAMDGSGRTNLAIVSFALERTVAEKLVGFLKSLSPNKNEAMTIWVESSTSRG